MKRILYSKPRKALKRVGEICDWYREHDTAAGQSGENMNKDMNPKKILVVSSGDLGKGGVQSIIMGISSKLRNITFDVLLFTSNKMEYDEEFLSFGGKIHRMPHYKGANKIRRKIDCYFTFPSLLIKSYKLMKNEGPYDAVHCHNNREAGIIVFAAYLTGIKLRITHSHSTNSRLNKRKILGYIYNRFLGVLINRYSNVKAGCSKEAFTALFGKKHLSKTGSYIIPGVIDLSLFNPVKENKNCGKRTILNIGRYSAEKNQIFLIELMPYIVKLMPDAILRLVGYDRRFENEYMKMKQKAKELNLMETIQFLPSDSDIPKILNDTDIFLLPSLFEGVAIVLMEAQAMGVPCLVSDSVPQESDCGLCKFLSLGESKERWAEEALKLMNDDTIKLNKDKLMGFDINTYAMKIADIYRYKEIPYSVNKKTNHPNSSIHDI